MKLLLLFALFSFSAHAQNMTLIDQNVNPNALTDAPYCVEDNTKKCIELGYTATGATELEACPYGGIACPFDATKTKWHCIDWKCSDFNMVDPSARVKNAICNNEVRIKGLTCYSCQCRQNHINTATCDVIHDLTSGAINCSALGYDKAPKDCAEYVACPTDRNKVHCLDVAACTETSCKSDIEVPNYADVVYTTKTCSCGGTKQVAVGWSCQEGYIKQGNICVEEPCPDNQFDTKNVANCYTLNAGKDYAAGAGWITEFRSSTAIKSCYGCICSPDLNAFKYDIANKSETEEYKQPSCDGKHYKECVRKCPSDLKEHDLPKYATAIKKECLACGTTSTYVDSWYCSDAKGYVLNKQKDGCDIKECPKPSNGRYYSVDYKSVADCQNIADGEGWSYSDSSGSKSDNQECAKCTCAYGQNDAVYKWTLASGSRDYMVLSDLGCNGKYKTCTLSQKAVADHLVKTDIAHAAQRDNYFICGENYYKLGSCVEGYEPNDDSTACVETDCSDYPLAIQPQKPEGGDVLFDTCKTGEYFRYKLEACYDDAVNNKDYEIFSVDGKAERCCLRTCEAGYTLDKTCAEGETAETIMNDCGEPCTKCTK